MLVDPHVWHLEVYITLWKRFQYISTPYSYPIAEVQTSEDHFFIDEKLISLWNVSPEDIEKYYSSDQKSHHINQPMLCNKN